VSGTEPVGDRGTVGTCRRAAVVLTQCWHRVPGGTAGSVLGLVAAVQAAGDVELVGVGPRGGAPHPGYAPTVPVVRTALPLPFLYDAWHTLRRPHLPRALDPLDVVHVTAPVVPPTGRVPMVATVHDLFPVTRPELLTPRGARLLRRGLELVRDQARVVMVPSEVVAADCRDFGIGADRVRVVPWGATPVDPQPSEVDAVRARYGVQGPYVLFVGTLEPRKNLARLVQAVARLGRPDLTLVVAGPDGWGDAPLDPAAAGVRTVLTGHVPSADLPALMAGADVFCFPSLAEGFGLPVLEAMAAGAPVVTSAGTACAEVAGTAAVLVDPLDVDSLAGGLARVLDDPALADRLRSAGRSRAAEFTWSAVGAATVAAYQDATSSRGGGSVR
jgi:glycosyltransferase involved in cell wall biosynthesis